MPRLVDREKKIAEITSKALDLFSEKGFEQTSIRDLADALQMSKGSLYAYFKNKEDIIRHGAYSYLADFASRMQEITETNPRLRIQAMFRQIFDMNEERKKMTLILYEIMLILQRGGLSEIRPIIVGMIEDFKKRLVLEIKAGKKDGSIRKDLATEATADALTALVDGLAIRSIWLGKGANIDQVIDRFLDEVLRKKS